jgi:hypothetical protein
MPSPGLSSAENRVSSKTTQNRTYTKDMETHKSKFNPALLLPVRGTKKPYQYESVDII